MSYKAVLFDLDGTLLDTLYGIAASCNRVLLAHQLDPHPLDAYRYFVGDGLMTLIERIVPEPGRDKSTLDSLADSFHKDYAKNWAEKTRAYQGITEMLSRLADLNIPMAVLSNKPHAFTKICVEKMLADFSFFPVLGQRDGIEKKPDPAGAFEVAEKLFLKPDQVLFLGDSSIDMLTAGRAGMIPVGALWGFRDEEELRKSGAKYLLSHPSMLIELLQAS